MENVEIKVQEMDYSGTEAYKSLRTNLQFCGEDKKVIAVTSCTPNEGKSSVTMNLAVSMAEAGKESDPDRCGYEKICTGGKNKSEKFCKRTDSLSFQTGTSDRCDLLLQCKESEYYICRTGSAKSCRTAWEAVILKRCWIPSKKYMITY